MLPGIVSGNPLNSQAKLWEEMEEMHLRDLEEEEMLQQKMQKPQSQRNTTVTWVKIWALSHRIHVWCIYLHLP